MVARPLVVLPLTAPLRLRRSERLFLAWAGLKGAVPILLAALAVRSNYESERLYGIVFVVVLFSVIVQGTSVRLLIPKQLATPASLEAAGRRASLDPAHSSLERFATAAGKRRELSLESPLTAPTAWSNKRKETQR